MLIEMRSAGVASQTPIFVVGMPRSVRTLIEQIVASHPGAFGAGEFEALQALVAQRGIRSRGTAISERDLAAVTTPAGLYALGNEYLQRLTSLAPHAARIVDKRLGNFAYVGID